MMPQRGFLFISLSPSLAATEERNDKVIARVLETDDSHHSWHHPLYQGNHGAPHLSPGPLRMRKDVQGVVSPPQQRGVPPGILGLVLSPSEMEPGRGRH
jgi:hypothetical protein